MAAVFREGGFALVALAVLREGGFALEETAVLREGGFTLTEAAVLLRGLTLKATVLLRRGFSLKSAVLEICASKPVRSVALGIPERRLGTLLKGVTLPFSQSLPSRTEDIPEH